MLGLANIGIPGSNFDAARRQGFLDKARQKEEERAGTLSRRRLVTDTFPQQDGIDLLINAFGKDYADGYRRGVAESSQTHGSESEQKTAAGPQTVGEVFRNNTIASIDKECRLLRSQIEQSMKEGMLEYATKKATERVARIYGWDVVFNINSSPKTRKELNARIQGVANETCKKLRKTRKWNSYPSDAVHETLRRIKTRIADQGIFAYAKRKIEEAKKRAEEAVLVKEDKIIRDAKAAAKKIREFCKRWEAEIQRWKKEFIDPIPNEDIFVENHEHMANDVMKLFPIMHVLFPGFNIDDKMREHELWAEAIELADPYADNHSRYTPIKFLRGWSANGIKLLLMHMQRQINKIEKTFEKIIVVDPEFVDDVIDKRQQNLAKKKELEDFRARTAKEEANTRRLKVKKQSEIARAKKTQEDLKRKQRHDREAHDKAREDKRKKHLKKATDALEKAGLSELIEQAESVSKQKRKRTVDQNVADMQAASNALANTPRSKSDVDVIAVSDSGSDSDSDSASANTPRSKSDVGVDVIASDSDNIFNFTAKQWKVKTQNKAARIILGAGVPPVESLWAAMKLNDSFFNSKKHRVDIANKVLLESYKKIEGSKYFNNTFVKEVFAFYKKTGESLPAGLPGLEGRWGVLTRHFPRGSLWKDLSKNSTYGASFVSPPVFAQAIPVATAWSSEHHRQHKKHFAKTMFNKCMSLISRFSPKKTKFARKPASVDIAVAVPLVSADARVFETRKFAPMKIHFDADTPILLSDIMSRG